MGDFTSTRRLQRWRPPISFTFARTILIIDGNKRAGANAAITFLFMNEWDLDMEEDELVELVLTFASSSMAKADLAAVFEKRCTSR